MTDPEHERLLAAVEAAKADYAAARTVAAAERPRTAPRQCDEH